MENNGQLNLGAFSIGLAVKDLTASKLFYEKLGFRVIHGDVNQNWLIIQNQCHVIGLFQGMFEKNTLTFNPGWDQNGKHVAPYTDIRDIQKELKSKGIEIQTEIDEDSTGPGHIVVLDPDGNPILIDQHR